MRGNKVAILQESDKARLSRFIKKMSRSGNIGSASLWHSEQDKQK